MANANAVCAANATNAATGADAGNSGGVPSGGGAVGAFWNEMEEFDLLDKYLDARTNRSLATDKGLCKSKFTQLMQDYDLYKYLTGLSGVGTCLDAGKPTFVDDVCEYLLPSKLKQRAKIVAMREHEFSHATIFCFIAGAQAGTILALTSELCRSDLDDDNASDTGDGGTAVSASDKTTTASAGLAKTSEEPASGRKVPGCHQKQI
ncbi:hypothetical protein PF006_g32073, partial [Phytophthora fragariae]